MMTTTGEDMAGAEATMTVVETTTGAEATTGTTGVESAKNVVRRNWGTADRLPER